MKKTFEIPNLCKHCRFIVDEHTEKPWCAIYDNDLKHKEHQDFCKSYMVVVEFLEKGFVIEKAGNV